MQACVALPLVLLLLLLLLVLLLLLLAGFRVLRVHPGSPAEGGDFELFFDFIVQIENELLCTPEVCIHPNSKP